MKINFCINIIKGILGVFSSIIGVFSVIGIIIRSFGGIRADISKTLVLSDRIKCGTALISNITTTTTYNTTTTSNNTSITTCTITRHTYTSYTRKGSYMKINLCIAGIPFAPIKYIGGVF